MTSTQTAVLIAALLITVVAVAQTDDKPVDEAQLEADATVISEGKPVATLGRVTVVVYVEAFRTLLADGQRGGTARIDTGTMTPEPQDSGP